AAITQPNSHPLADRLPAVSVPMQINRIRHSLSRIRMTESVNSTRILTEQRKINAHLSTTQIYSSVRFRYRNWKGFKVSDSPLTTLGSNPPISSYLIRDLRSGSLTINKCSEAP